MFETNSGKVTGLAQKLQVGPRFFLQIPINGLKLAQLLGHPYNFYANAAGIGYTKISIDIYILADALNLITFEWIALLSVCRMIATHSSNRSGC
jgi:hypothetical protein